MIGVDVLARNELERLLEREWFVRFSYSAEEIAGAHDLGPDRRLEFLAGRFAAKEAVLKALGRGMSQGVALRDVSITRSENGRPVVGFRGRAAELGLPPVALSITHKEDVVAAVAISEVQPDRARPADEGAETTACLRVRLSHEDAHYGGGLVDGARVLRLFGDLVTEITIRTDGDEGLLANYSEIRFTAPVRPGDYLEVTAKLVRSTRLRRIVELRAYKVITARTGARPSAAEVLSEPELVCSATATTVIPLVRDRGQEAIR